MPAGTMSLVFSYIFRMVMWTRASKGRTIWYPGGGHESFLKKKLYPLLRLKKKKKTSLTWGVKKKQTNKQTNFAAKGSETNKQTNKFNPTAKFDGEMVIFEKKKKSPTCETKKKKNFIHLRSKKKKRKLRHRRKKMLPDPNFHAPLKSNGAPLKHVG